MTPFKDVSISLGEYDLSHGKGKMAVFMYSGAANPKSILDFAVREFVGNKGYHELIDANLDNPWMRVILSDINNIPQEPFDPANPKHKL